MVLADRAEAEICGSRTSAGAKRRKLIESETSSTTPLSAAGNKRGHFTALAELWCAWRLDPLHPIGMTIVSSRQGTSFTSSSQVMAIQDPSTPTFHDAQRTHHLLMMEFGDRTQFDDPKLEYRRLFSELLGIFMLGARRAGGELPHAKGQTSLAAAVVAPGLMVLAIILFMGAVSGAHLNPAVSLAFAVRGHFERKRVPGYIIRQLLGATLACLFLLAVFGNVEHPGATLPGAGYHDWQAFLMGIALTGVLLERDPSGRPRPLESVRSGRLASAVTSLWPGCGPRPLVARR